MARGGEAAGVRARTPAGRAFAGRATVREVGVVAAVLTARSEKEAARRLGLSHSTAKHHLANARSRVGATTTAQLVWVLARRLAEPADQAEADRGHNGRHHEQCSQGAIESDED